MTDNLTDEEYWESRLKDRIKSGSLMFNQEKALNMLQRFTKAPLLAEINALEIGCGSGYWGYAFQWIYPNIKYTGIELSKSCVKSCKENGLNVLHGNIKKLEFPDNSFNLILLLDVLEHINPDIRTSGYEEIKRVLQSPGLIIINNPISVSAHSESHEWMLSQQDINDFVIAINGKIMHLETYTTNNTYQYQFIAVQV